MTSIPQDIASGPEVAVSSHKLKHEIDITPSACVAWTIALVEKNKLKLKKAAGAKRLKRWCELQRAGERRGDTT